MKNLLLLFVVLLMTGCAATTDLGTYKVDMVGEPEIFEVVCKNERRANNLAKRIGRQCDKPETNSVIIMLTPHHITCKHKFLWKEYGYLRENEYNQIKALMLDNQ